MSILDTIQTIGFFACIWAINEIYEDLKYVFNK